MESQITQMRVSWTPHLWFALSPESNSVLAAILYLSANLASLLMRIKYCSLDDSEKAVIILRQNQITEPRIFP